MEEKIMSANISELKIERLIVHEVLKQYASEAKEQPRLSEIESPLNENNKHFLRDRIEKTIGSGRSYQVVFEEDPRSPIPEIIQKLLTKDDSEPISDLEPISDSHFVSLSKDIAIRLNRVQDGKNPAGLVIIIMGTIQDVEVVGILKLEREEGIRLEQTERKGKLTYDMLHLRDLILTEKTKLFKIGLFFKDGLEKFGYNGKICDNQLSYSRIREAADFFLISFLGCRLAKDPRAETKEFFINSQRFFEETIEDPILRTTYNLHLLSYVSSEAITINAFDFAQLYLKVVHRDSYTNYLGEKKIRLGDIIRDISLIKNRIRKMRLDFENGISIIGDQDIFREEVKLEDLGDDTVRAEIVSRVRKIRT
jgi:hypothetical protein